MSTNINSLPFELLSKVLEEATVLTIRDAPTFRYGLSSVSGLTKDDRLQRTLRGHVVPDALKWRATETLRQVNRQWHDWASLYALGDLYITRWRGSERWMQSRKLDTLQGKPSTASVYRDPYHSLKETLQLFQGSPGLGSCVRRLWFNGYYSAETVRMMFGIIRHCTNLDHLTVPWTTLRYGAKDDWSQLLSRRPNRREPLSLEFLAVNLSEQKVADSRNQHDERPMQFSRLDFSRVERLKIFGNTNFMPVTDDDLVAISRTATNLKEIHITGTSTTTIDGVMALSYASHNFLQVLEHSPLSSDGFEHPHPTSTQGQGHLCQELRRYPQIRDLSISLPSLCEDLFRDNSVHWRGEVQIRAGSLCNHPEAEIDAHNRFWRILDLARALMAERDQIEDAKLDIELYVNYWIFEPRHIRVHGNIELGQALSDGAWPLCYSVSTKGPYGQTGLYGKDERPYSCISENDFVEGLKHGYITF